MMQDLDRLSADAQKAIIKQVILVTIGAVVASVLITVALGYLIKNVPPAPIGLIIAVVAPLIIAPCGGYWSLSMAYRLRQANELLRSLSETDSLTNTLNRRKFLELAERELALAERHSYPTSIVILDFDDFKQINDQYGHAVGDKTLVQVVEVINSVIRESDILARFGGEEFILLLPHTIREGAQSLANRMLERVAATPVQFDGGSLTTTLSAGSVTCETSGTPLDVLMSRADELLYESKQNGRNQCTAETIVNLVSEFRRA